MIGHYKIGVFARKRFLRTLVCGLISLGFGSGTSSKAANYTPSNIIPPGLQREFRGVWVATVANIDWPAKGSSAAEQKADLIAMLDRAVELKLNTVIFQVRPACDALYPSSLEPWSEYLTGTMGKAPEPYYDPLLLVIEEAHARGLELHAWFNPYRARVATAKSPVASGHISRTHPELVRRYGGMLWLDPGEKAVQDYSARVVMDVLKRYDVDGVHFDDYFYPYKEKDSAGRDLPFPDDASWQRYGQRSGLTREDWRRENVNNFVQRIYESIKATKPWVKFGVSPFGIWRPGFPASVRGYDAYAWLYADSRKWLAKGWLDYFVPQLYWRISAPEQSFPVLLKWWSDQNARGRLLVAGIDATQTRRSWPVDEIVNQVRTCRRSAGASGEVYWSMRALLRNTPLEGALEREVYAEPAVVPPCPWLSRSTPTAPQVTVNVSGRSAQVNWSMSGVDHPAFWVLQTRSGRRWTTRILSGARASTRLENRPEVLAVTAIDRFGAASRAVVLEGL